MSKAKSDKNSTIGSAHGENSDESGAVSARFPLKLKKFLI